MPIYQFGKLLVSLFPIAYKLWQMWLEHHQLEADKQNRMQLTADIKDAVDKAVAAKSVVGLEEMIKSLGKPRTPSVDALNPKT